MKKELKISMYYLVFALISGVFYREFTKWNGFVGTTALSKTHLHLFVLGTFLYLILALFVMATDLKQQKEYSIFQKVYQYALPAMIILFYVRGIVQVLNIQLSKGLDASISGVAGITHIAVMIAFIYLFKALWKSSERTMINHSTK